MLRVLNQTFDQSMEMEECAAAPLAGGIALNGYQCGMLWGATLAAGAESYQRFGAGLQAQSTAVSAAGKLAAVFSAQNKHVNCIDITGIDKSSSVLKMMSYFWLQGGVIRCLRRASKFANAAYREIDDALSTSPETAPPDPVSCAVVAARKLGLSPLHAHMASGLAGGIGLRGGGCGALGTAVWAVAMQQIAEGKDPLNFKHPKYEATIDRFKEAAGDSFECAEIVGKKFESIEDHARHLKSGGCAKIIDALSS